MQRTITEATANPEKEDLEKGPPNGNDFLKRKGKAMKNIKIRVQTKITHEYPATYCKGG